MTFNYSKNGLSVSYNGEINISIIRGVRDVPTVYNESGEMFVEITTNGKTEKRTDILTKRQRNYITQNLVDNNDCVEVVGNRVCELYHGMIK